MDANTSFRLDPRRYGNLYPLRFVLPACEIRTICAALLGCKCLRQQFWGRMRAVQALPSTRACARTREGAARTVRVGASHGFGTLRVMLPFFVCRLRPRPQ